MAQLADCQILFLVVVVTGEQGFVYFWFSLHQANEKKNHGVEFSF